MASVESTFFESTFPEDESGSNNEAFPKSDIPPNPPPLPNSKVAVVVLSSAPPEEAPPILDEANDDAATLSPGLAVNDPVKDVPEDGDSPDGARGDLACDADFLSLFMVVPGALPSPTVAEADGGGGVEEEEERELISGCVRRSRPEKESEAADGDFDIPIC